MAKKVVTSDSDKNAFLESLIDKVKDINPFADRLDLSTVAEIKEYINTGNYHLNAVITGSLFKGIPSGRIITLSGTSGVGKTFLSLNISREAQKQGYTIFYLDTEGAISREDATKMGINPKSFYLIPVADLVKLKEILINMIQPMIENKKKGVENPKMLFVLDSLGMMASSKEILDAASGSDKVDFTRAKLIRGLFRLLTNDLRNLGIPMIVTNHTVTDVGSMYPQFQMSGGQGIVYATSATISFNQSKLKDDKDDVQSQTGILVSAKAEKNRFAKKSKKIQFHIHFSKGMNPYVGLQEYLDWETCGIQKGMILLERDKNKLSEKEQEKLSKFTNDENIEVYFQPKETSRNYVCKHLGRYVKSINELYSNVVFTNEVLTQIDEIKIKPLFYLGSDNLDDDLLNLENDETTIQDF